MAFFENVSASPLQPVIHAFYVLSAERVIYKSSCSSDWIGSSYLVAINSKNATIWAYPADKICFQSFPLEIFSFFFFHLRKLPRHENIFQHVLYVRRNRMLRLSIQAQLFKIYGRPQPRSVFQLWITESFLCSATRIMAVSCLLLPVHPGQCFTVRNNNPPIVACGQFLPWTAKNLWRVEASV